MKELVLKYRDKEKYDFSCSETILHAANEKYNLGIDDKAFKMIAPFSGGMYEGRLCGIVPSSLSVLGILFTDGVSHTSPVLQEATKEYLKLWEEKFDTKSCVDLKEEYREELVGCQSLIIMGAEILETVVDKYKK